MDPSISTGSISLIGHVGRGPLVSDIISDFIRSVCWVQPAAHLFVRHRRGGVFLKLCLGLPTRFALTSLYISPSLSSTLVFHIYTGKRLRRRLGRRPPPQVWGQPAAVEVVAVGGQYFIAITPDVLLRMSTSPPRGHWHRAINVLNTHSKTHANAPLSCNRARRGRERSPRDAPTHAPGLGTRYRQCTRARGNCTPRDGSHRQGVTRKGWYVRAFFLGVL